MTKLTSDRWEDDFELAVDKLDRQYLNSDMTQEQYDKAYADLAKGRIATRPVDNSFDGWCIRPAEIDTHDTQYEGTQWCDHSEQHETC